MFDAAEVDSSIISYKKSDKNHVIELLESTEMEKIDSIAQCDNSTFINNDDCIININLFKNSQNITILQTIEKNSKLINPFYADVKCGVKVYEVGAGVPKQTKEIKESRGFHALSKIDNTYFPYIDGNDVKRYALTWDKKEFVKYGKHMSRPRLLEYFTSPRILVRQIPSRLPYCINACYTEEIIINDLNSMNIVGIKCNPYFLLGVLNSKAISFWFAHKFGKLERGLFPQFKVNELSIFPIPDATQEQQEDVATLTNAMLSLNKDLQAKRARFLRRLKDNMPEVKVTGALETFDNLDFAGFVAELKKQKIRLSLVQQDEWEDYFRDYKTTCNDLSAQIAATDRDIDTRVYALYGLTEDEITVIEG